MKVFVLLMCTVASTTASNAVAWPGAIPIQSTYVKTVIPPQIDSFGYSTSQYINAIPPQLAHQQFGYQIALPGYHAYPPVVSSSYFPSNSFLYPSFAPIAPPNTPPTEQPKGDEDSAVIDSADFPSGQQQPALDMPQPQQPQPPFQRNPPPTSLDAKNMPAISQIPSQFPQIPKQIPQFPNQISQLPSQIPSFPQIPQTGSNFPQIPQLPNQVPSFPQIPQIGSNFPQIPQLPQLPMNPLFPQSPSSSLPSFPPADNVNQGFNDEDSVSVDSA